MSEELQELGFRSYPYNVELGEEVPTQDLQMRTGPVVLTKK